MRRSSSRAADPSGPAAVAEPVAAKTRQGGEGAEAQPASGATAAAAAGHRDTDAAMAGIQMVTAAPPGDASMTQQQPEAPGSHIEAPDLAAGHALALQSGAVPAAAGPGAVKDASAAANHKDIAMPHDREAAAALESLVTDEGGPGRLDDAEPGARKRRREALDDAGRDSGGRHD